MTITIFGIHPVLEALKKRPRSFHRIVLAKQAKEGPNKQYIAALAEKHGIKIYFETAKNLSRLACSDQHQGMAAEVEPYALLDLQTVISGYRKKKEKAFLLALDSVQDPHNLGSLIRSAFCCGVQAVIFPKDRAARLTGTVAKSSAGAIEHMPLCRVVNLSSALKTLQQAGLWVVGTAPGAGESIYEFDFNLDMALVIGGEEKGMRPLIMKKCDFCLSIPLQGALDSLNASVAGAVVMFEAMRQRMFGK